MTGIDRLLTRASVLLLGAAFLPLCLAGAKAQNAAGRTAPSYFSETFADPAVSSPHWEQTTNGGSLLFAKGGVFLKGIGGGFPVIKTRQNPFPLSGDWTASFGYRYTSVGNYGTDLACLGPNGEKVADVHQDVNAQLLQVTDNVLSAKANTEWHVVSFVMTGNRIAVYLDGTLTGERSAGIRPTGISIGGWLMSNPWDWNDLQVALVSVSTGKHVLDKSALHLNELFAESATQSVFLPPHDAFVTDVREDDKSVYCVLGDTLRLAGTTSGQHRLDRRSLTVNGQPYSDSAANPNEDGYSFDWKPTAPGTYKIAVRFTLQQPFAVLPVKDVTVTVLPKAPLALQQFSKPVPASCPIAVQPVDTALFQPARVEFFLNGQAVGAADKAPFQITLPISKQTPGTYAVSYVAYDAQGARWNGESETVTVPLRVKLMTPANVNIASEKDQIPFTADIVPGLKVVRVDYSVDSQRVASTATPPYDVPVKLSSFKSGSHAVEAEVLVEDGETFINPPTTMNLTNQPDDIRQAKIAKDEADKKARLRREEQDRQAMLDKQAADQIAARLAVDRNAKLKEATYKQEVADNTIQAVRDNQLNIILDGDLSKIGDSYLFSLKITNRTNKVVGPFEPEMRFDDFSFTEPLAYDGSLSKPFDDNGFPTKYLDDPYHDLVVPANSSKSLEYYVNDTLSLDKLKKPTKVTFMGTLRGFSISVKP